MLDNGPSEPWRTMPSVFAECEDCDWHRDVAGTSDSDNARAAAKRHAHGAGHLVRVERTTTTYIDGRDDAS
jgi:hypothetical protein